MTNQEFNASFATLCQENTKINEKIDGMEVVIKLIVKVAKEPAMIFQTSDGSVWLDLNPSIKECRVAFMGTLPLDAGWQEVCKMCQIQGNDPHIGKKAKC